MKILQVHDNSTDHFILFVIRLNYILTNFRKKLDFCCTYEGSTEFLMVEAKRLPLVTSKTSVINSKLRLLTVEPRSECSITQCDKNTICIAIIEEVGMSRVT